MSTHNTTYLHVKENGKDIPIMPPDLALISTLIGLNYPYLELIFMVPKVFEPLKFYCILKNYIKHIAKSVALVTYHPWVVLIYPCLSDLEVL